MSQEIRNIAIIAHVDHGKTTLTDAILKQAGAAEEGLSMDSNALEKERGITIYSKNAAVEYKETKINIVDTPGHADFGSEVERVLRSVDCVLLIVDAQEGPMPQTRFVLKKSLELGHKPILVINKIDKPAADADRTHDLVFDLFAELGANNEQLDFPMIYAIGKDGVAMREAAGNRQEAKVEDKGEDKEGDSNSRKSEGEKGGEPKDMSPLLDMILEKVPVANKEESQNADFKAQAFNLAYDNFLGRLAITRVYDGSISVGESIFVKKPGGEVLKCKVTKLFTFIGTTRVEAKSISSGDIAIIAGMADVYIGDTLASSEELESLPAIAVERPTMELTFLVNNSPFAGREGKFVTSRQIRERLEKELEVNVGLKVDFESAGGDQFLVKGRGELHISILLENMRREGYELQVSQPRVIFREEDGVKKEPFEEITVDVPEQLQGAVIESLSKRGAIVSKMENHEGRVLMLFEGPSRGLFGYRAKFVVDTKGEGILATRVIGYRPFVGEIERKEAGSMISGETGKALAFSLNNLQVRGELYIGANTEVYEGMVIGNTAKGKNLTVNPIKGKHLTNMRASGADDAINLTPPKEMTVESGLEIVGKDEYLEITPESVRLRKIFLKESERKRQK